MEVELLDYTKDAIEKLIFTKETRLQGKHTIEDIKEWSDEDKNEAIQYMFGTIQSSFEFVDFTFLISGVSRSFTHQLVRTRGASYAQESMRAVKVSDRGVVNPSGYALFDIMSGEALDNYDQLLTEGLSIQDAREILPTGIETSIIIKINLREFSRMADVRLCYRASGEYQEVVKMMKKEVVDIYPELEPMIRVHCARTGMCCFPNYKKCPIQSHAVVVPQFRKDNIQQLWLNTDHQADPGIY